MATKKWYERTVGDASVNAVASKADLVQSTLARQLKAESLTAEVVIAVARAYEADVIGALVECGFVTTDEVRLHGARVTLASLTDLEVGAELVRRTPHVFLDSPIT